MSIPYSHDIREKDFVSSLNLFVFNAINQGADQPAQLRSLVSAFINRSLESPTCTFKMLL